MSDENNEAIAQFFLRHIRTKLNARRLIHALSKFSMMSSQSDQLRPAHYLCHWDLGGPEGSMNAASVLYFFKDESLGGTSFYVPKKSEKETAALVHDSLQMTAQAFEGKDELCCATHRRTIETLFLPCLFLRRLDQVGNYYDENLEPSKVKFAQSPTAKIFGSIVVCSVGNTTS